MKPGAEHQAATLNRPPLLLTVVEAAAELRISKRTCYELINAGKLPYCRLHKDGDVRIPRPLLEQWILQQSGDWAALLQPAEEPDEPPAKKPIEIKRGRKSA